MEDSFTIQEAADYLKVSEPTIYRWMKEGTLSFYKVGRKTRFTKQHLESIKVGHTSKLDAEKSRLSCSCCGHNEMVPGKLQSTGLVYFKPDKSKFFTFDTSTVPTTAWVCAACGFVQLHTDPEKLQRLKANHE